MVKTERVQILKVSANTSGSVIYWMSRDQRVNDNWAFSYAQEIAVKNRKALAVVFCLTRNFSGATLRQYDFMLRGMKEVYYELTKLNIPFYILCGEPPVTLSEFISKNKISHVITDFDPLKIKRQWKEELINSSDISLYEVDAHNIVPCRFVSNKCEFGAYTLRPKIKKSLSAFVDEFPSPETQKNIGSFAFQAPEWELILEFLSPEKTVVPVDWIKPGSIAAKDVLKKFLVEKLELFYENRNDPNENATSNLSPYLHFGHISAQRIALEIMKNFKGNASTESFLEELIVRRELSDNYCYYNSQYDEFSGFPEWARKTLNEHRKDERDFCYDFETFETGKTHDPLWNAAQMEMVKSGKMHGYMRMYWAKKILEWTVSPEEALDFSIRLNDRYQLDGRDPNGYTGCAWSIGGVHDRAWAERPVFGKIRFMNFNGCKRKFDTDKYIASWL